MPLISLRRISDITNIKWFYMLQRGIMHLSPLSSSKEIDSARYAAGFFFAQLPSRFLPPGTVQRQYAAQDRHRMTFVIVHRAGRCHHPKLHILSRQTQPWERHERLASGEFVYSN
ncbi:MAG: hypothetical protein RSH52_33570, partial [Janthinobacterium sp.]